MTDPNGHSRTLSARYYKDGSEVRITEISAIAITTKAEKVYSKNIVFPKLIGDIAANWIFKPK